jgi:hypothetical protein
MNTFGKVRDMIMALEDDFEKFYDKSNSAAGTRVRKGMQELKTLATEIRKAVQDMKNDSKGSGSSTGGAKASGGAKSGGAKASGGAKSGGAKASAGGAKSGGASKGGKK